MEPPPRKKFISQPQKNVSEIFAMPQVASRLSQMLDVTDTPQLRLVDRRSYHAFQETFQSVVFRRYGLSNEKIREFLATNDIDLWAAGSSVLQTYIEVGSMGGNAEDRQFLEAHPWSSGDLDLYINPRITSPPDHYDRIHNLMKKLWESTPVEVTNALKLLQSMGYTQTQHFKDEWDSKFDAQFMDDKEIAKEEAKIEERNKLATYSGGFMKQNKIRDIYTFVRNSDPSVQVQLVVIIDKGDNSRFDIKKVIDNFDLTCCSIGYDFRSSQVYISPDARSDIVFRRMTLRGSYLRKFSEGNYILHKRVAKYTSRGFTLTNPVPFTEAVLKLRTVIARLKLELSDMEIREERRNFHTTYLEGGRKRSAAYLRNSIAILEERIRNIENGNFSALVHETIEDKLEKTIDTYRRLEGRNVENVKKYEKLLNDEPFDDEEGDVLHALRYSEKLKALQRVVPDGTPKDYPDRIRLHQFKLGLKMLKSARFKGLSLLDCSNIDDNDFISLQPINELVKRFQVYKRVVYKNRPNRAAGNESEDEDVESQADTPINIVCYGIDGLQKDIDRQRRDRHDALVKWPNDRQIISDIDILRIKIQNYMFKWLEDNIDYRERIAETMRKIDALRESGTKWQKVLIGGKVRLRRRSLSPRRKSPRRTRKLSLRRKSRKSRRSRKY